MDYNVDDEAIDFDKLIIEIYDAALTRKWGRVLAQCNRVFFANKTFLVLRDAINNREVAWRMKSRRETSTDLMTKTDFSLLSFLSPFLIKLHEGDAFNTGSDEFAELKHAKAITDQILIPLEAEKTLVALVLRDERYEAYFGVCRSSEDDSFSTYEMVAFKRLLPHFVRAARFFRDEELFRQQKQLSQGLYDHIKTAFVVCDGQLRVQACNTQAEQYLAHGKTVFIQKGKLAFSMPHQHAKFLERIRTCLESASNDVAVHVVDENINVVEIFHIHKLTSHAEHERREPLAVVNIIARGKPDWLNVQSCYALSKKEVLIARMLYKDASYKDIARAASLTEDDVSVQVNRLIKAVGVKNEEALIDQLAMFSGASAKIT